MLGQPLGPQSIYNIVRQYGAAVDPNLRPHDLRRSFARLAYEGRAPLEQLSIAMGHASVLTTERYIAARQDFRISPCDFLPASIPTDRDEPATPAESNEVYVADMTHSRRTPPS